MIDLPNWCANPLGRELIAAVIASPPEQRTIRHRLPSIYGGHPDGTSTTYAGNVAGRLRQMRSEWVQRELWKLDRDFIITNVWDAAASERVLRCEEANALIERVLADRADERRAA